MKTKESILVFIIGLAFVIIGLHGVYGSYELSFTTSKLSIELSWFCFSVGLLIIAYLNIFLTIDYRTTYLNEKKYLDQRNYLQERYSEVVNLYNETEIKYRATETQLETIRKQYQVSKDKVVSLEVEFAKFIKQTNKERNDLKIYKNLYTSRNASLVKAKNDYQALKEQFENLNKRYASLNISYSKLMNESTQNNVQ